MEFKFIDEGLDKLIAKLNLWGESVVKMIPNLVIAILLVFFFMFLGRWVRSVFKRVLSRTHFNLNLQNLLANCIQIIILCLGFVLALAVLELQKTVFSLLAGIGVIGLALGFAFQDLASNFMSGIMLAIRSPLKVGDVIEIGDTFGSVKEVRLRDTIIENFSGQEIFIPNKEFTGNKFTNYSSNGLRKLEIKVGVGYEDDPEQAVKVVTGALNEMEGIVKDPEPVAYIEELGGSSVNLIGHVWFKYPGNNFFVLRNQAYILVKKRLSEEGFNIPFPIRTLDFPKSFLKTFNQGTEKSSNSHGATI